MLLVSNLTKRFQPYEPPILDSISFIINAGERMGLVGANGAGKSTLIRIITGEMQPDSGSVQFMPSNLRIGYLPQGFMLADTTPIEAILYPQLAQLHHAEREVERLGEAIANASSTELAPLMHAYSLALDQLERLSTAIPAGKGEAILAGLGLAQLPLNTPLGNLSGGQKTRLGMASLLVNDPQLLILDEPTNHLDVSALEWLEDWLNDFAGGVLMVSHDRTFLDKTANHILALDQHHHTAKVYAGNYRTYATAIQSERDRQWSEWRDQQVEIERVRQDIQRKLSHAQSLNKAGLTDASRDAARRAKARESHLRHYLESEERVERPENSWQLKLDFQQLPPTGQDVIFIENLTIGYTPEHPLATNLNLVVRASERIAIVGQNGHGKSTLLKTILGEVAPLAGGVRLGASVKVGYLAQEQDTLNPQSNALETLQTEVQITHTEARSFLHFFLFEGDEVFRPIHLLSYGERTRLMLAILVARGANLLILDEPINHLDIPSRERFEQALKQFQGSVLAVVHDRYFVDQFATTVWRVANGELHVEIRDPLFA